MVSAGRRPAPCPTLSGKSYEEAVAALRPGLGWRRVDQYSDDDDRTGKVIGTDPPSGATRQAGRQGHRHRSTGRPVVPKLNGLTVDEATAALAAVGLKVDEQVRARRRQGLPRRPGRGRR